MRRHYMARHCLNTDVPILEDGSLVFLLA